MSDKIQVTSQETNGINFYVSADGKESGMSKKGLSNLSGVSHQTIGRLIKLVAEGLPENMDKIPERLIPHSKTAVTRCQSSVASADIIPSNFCSDIIKYYAFDLKNEVALYSCEKFMDMGVDNWIKKVVGFSESIESSPLLNALNENMGKLRVEMQDLKEIATRTEGYRRATVSLPLLEKWMDSLSDEAAAKILEPAQQLYTVKEAIDKMFPGLILDKTSMKKLALKVGQTINALSDRPNLKKKTKNSRGYDMEVNGYSEVQLPLIRLCYLSIISEM
jgi:hypothetical protein